MPLLWGETLTYAYLPQGTLDTVATTYGIAMYVRNSTYDAAGRITWRELGQNGSSPYLEQGFWYKSWTEANGQGRLANLAVKKPDNTFLMSYGYTYDAVGNITSMSDWIIGSPQTQTFTYDALNRLTSGVATGGVNNNGNYALETYGYNNQNGNLTSKAGVSMSYNAQAAGCALDFAHAVTTAGTTTYCYDQNGNMVRRDPSGGGNNHDFTYDAENRLVEVKYNGTTIATFVYDGDGNRLKATINGVTTTFIGNWFEWSGSQNTQIRYYYAAGQRIAMRVGSGGTSSTLTYLLGDHLGSTSLTFKADTYATVTQLYKPWGEVRYSSGTLPTDYTYTGQYSHTADFGLMYYVARWYDPLLGRFAQADTIIPGAGNPLAWDRYAYTLNNPLRYIDPSGHIACEDLGTEDCDETGDYTNKDVSGATPSVEVFLDYIARRINRFWRNKNDLEGMARITEVAAVFYDSFETLLPVLSSIFNGIYESGPMTLQIANQRREDGLLDYHTTAYPFRDTGFHVDFADGKNQVYHVWPYIVQGANGLDGYIIGLFGNYVHDGLQPTRTKPDYALAMAGLEIGWDIHQGLITTAQLGATLRSVLGTKGPGMPGLEYPPKLYP